MSKNKIKILVLCVGNSNRSQIAQAILQSFDPALEVRSAGTCPGKSINPMAVRCMKEIGIDISKHCPTSVEEYKNDEWDYVITVCGDAEKECPIFYGLVKHKLHIGFDDISTNQGKTLDETYCLFQGLRDCIKERFYAFYISNLKDYGER